MSRRLASKTGSAAFALLAAALLFPLCGIPLVAQLPPPPPEQDETPTIKVDVDLVNVLFSVRDKKGRLIPDLTKDDFTVAEDGKSQTIKYFARETDLPLTLGLLVDVSVSQENLLDIERRAAASFFAGVLRPKDMAFLISFGTESELLQDFTSSPELLNASLNDLRIQGSPSLPGMVNPGPFPTQPRGTVMFEAVYLAATEKLRHEVGRKAMVLITDGVDVGSRTKRSEAIEAAQKADAIIYSIEYSDPRYAGFGNGEGDLKRMAEETGGRLFHVDRKHSLEDIFKEIQDEMRSQYAIAYTPTNGAKDGTFRKLEIRAKNKDLRVQARTGYYATAEKR